MRFAALACVCMSLITVRFFCTVWKEGNDLFQTFGMNIMCFQISSRQVLILLYQLNIAAVTYRPFVFRKCFWKPKFPAVWNYYRISRQKVINVKHFQVLFRLCALLLRKFLRVLDICLKNTKRNNVLVLQWMNSLSFGVL